MCTVKLQNSSIFVNVSDAGKIHGQNSNETSGASEDLCTSHVQVMLTVLHTFLLTGIQAFKIGKSRAISSKSSKFSLRYALGKLFACRKRLCPQTNIRAYFCAKWRLLLISLHFKFWNHLYFTTC